MPRPYAARSSTSSTSRAGARGVQPGEGLVEQQQAARPARARGRSARAGAGRPRGRRTGGRRRSRSPTAPSASRASRRSRAPRPAPPGQARDRPHQGDVERADRVVEARPLGLRDSAAQRARPRRSRSSGASSPMHARKSVVLPPPFGPSTPIRSPGAHGERRPPRGPAGRRRRPRRESPRPDDRPPSGQVVHRMPAIVQPRASAGKARAPSRRRWPPPSRGTSRPASRPARGCRRTGCGPPSPRSRGRSPGPAWG